MRRKTPRIGFWFTGVLVAFAAAGAHAGSPATLKISIGVRATGTTAPIGDDGGTTGPIEWINMDAQTLVLDGTWQTFTFQLSTATITAFTGNGALDGVAGTLEHIRIKSDGNTDGPISIWIDRMVDTITPSGSPPMHVLIQGWEFYPPGSLVTFRHPSFSPTTSGHVQLEGNANTLSQISASGVMSEYVRFQFIDLDPSRWVRLTTAPGGGISDPNPAIRFDQNSTITFRMLGRHGCTQTFECNPCCYEPGACCIHNGVALLLTQPECQELGGVFMGPGTAPSDVTCPAACGEDVAPPGGDGFVNVNDLLAIINAWGSCP